MRKFFLFMTAALAFAAVSCSEDSKEDNTTGNGDLAMPEVSFKSVTPTSFTAEWPAVEGADSYRYEVTYLNNGRPSAVAAANITGTTFSLDALRPSTEYIVRVVAKAGEKMSVNWYNGNVTTLGSADVEFTVTPYERYYEKEGYVYPYAKVEVSNPDVYYWVSAIPVGNKDSAKKWIEEDIAFYLKQEVTWDELVEEKLILKGSSDSSPFLFVGSNQFYFIAAPVEKTIGGVGIIGEPVFSHQFFSAGTDVTMMHKSSYETFTGDWVVRTYGTVSDVNGSLKVEAGESFPVKIAATQDKKSLELTGWGGARNKFSGSPLKFDFEHADDNYHMISVSFPQEIRQEGEIVWKYCSWYYFAIAGEKPYYLPFDDKMAEDMPSWKKGFRGFVGNLNKTVIKIFPEDYTDPNTGDGATMMSIWPYGISTTGNPENDKFLNNEYNHPAAFYFLVRKDVADGKILELPDTSLPDQSSVLMKVASEQAAIGSDGRVFRRLNDAAL